MANTNIEGISRRDFIKQAVFLPPVLMNVLREPSFVGPTLPTLEDFSLLVSGQDGKKIYGVYAPGDTWCVVKNQPPNDDSFVWADKNSLTRFNRARIPNIGLLAHDYLKGAAIAKFKIGQEIDVIWGNYKTLAKQAVGTYFVNTITKFQALDPSNIHSNFIHLTTGDTWTFQKLYDWEYEDPTSRVTFQTCFSYNGIPNWGRIFVTANLQN